MSLLNNHLNFKFMRAVSSTEGIIKLYNVTTQNNFFQYKLMVYLNLIIIIE